MFNGKISLTPEEIYEKEFKVDARGYRPQEVDNFLDEVIKDYSAFIKIIRGQEKEIQSLSLENTDAPRDITVLRMLIGQAIDIAINISHVVKADGKRTRRIDDIIKINGYERKEDKYLLEKVDPEMYLQADEKTGSNTVQNFNGSGLGT